MSSVSQLGKFEITGELGKGSFGVVYRGRDPHLNRDVAIKVCTLDDEELRQRFLREAAISGRLDHRNIVTVHEYSSDGPTPYLVQEFLSGSDLRQVIKERRAWSVAQRLDALLGIAEGLAYAHGEGVIHRDIKPANIRVDDDGRVKILDFGIAKLANDESRLTQKGVTMGTASYLPPEQVRGGDVDTRSDLFSFGVLAYELLTFERPFRGKTISALVYQILYKVPAALKTVWPDCPEELSDLVARCLEKEPDKRFAKAEEVVEALAAIKAGVAAGRWPSLAASAVAGPPAGRDEDSSVSKSDLLSQSMISRAADEADSAGGDVMEETSTAAVMPPRDSEATQPVPIISSVVTAANAPTALIDTAAIRAARALPKDPQEAATVSISTSKRTCCLRPCSLSSTPINVATRRSSMWMRS
ncbi:MAG: serine/threonine-protein kinase, partial [Acidobacteriota bacterium]